MRVQEHILAMFDAEVPCIELLHVEGMNNLLMVMHGSCLVTFLWGATVGPFNVVCVFCVLCLTNGSLCQPRQGASMDMRNDLK